MTSFHSPGCLSGGHPHWCRASRRRRRRPEFSCKRQRVLRHGQRARTGSIALAAPLPARALEPIGFGGVVEGSATGFYEGYGTFNSSNGSAHTHFSGQVNYGKNCEGHADCEAVTTKNCWGHIDYTTNEILVPGGVIPLPPVVR